MSLEVWTWPERAGVTLRLVVPYIFIIFLFLLDLIPFHIPPFGEIRPCFSIMAIFYWSVYRPTLIPNWFVFLLGLMLDLVSGLPLGLNAFIFLLTYWIISDQRRVFVGQPFITIMLGFALVLSVSNIMRWVLFSLVSGAWPPFMPVLGIILSGLFYVSAYQYAVTHDSQNTAGTGDTHYALPDRQTN